MTDAPAPSAEVEKARGLSDGQPFLDKYTATLEYAFEARMFPGMIRIAEAEVAADMARDDLAAWIATAERALTAERERVKALEAEVEEQKNVGVLWMLDASGERHERQQAEARATAAEAQVREMREALEAALAFAIEVAEANNGVGAFRELEPEDDTLEKVIGRMAENARELKVAFRATLAATKEGA